MSTKENAKDAIKEIKEAEEKILVLQQIHGSPVDGQPNLLTALASDIYDKVKADQAPADKKPRRSAESALLVVSLMRISLCAG